MMKTIANGRILINMPEGLCKARDMKDEVAYVYITIAKGCTITLWDLADVFETCFEKYPVEYREYAPIIHAFVKIGEKNYTFKIRCVDEESEYILQLSRQFVL